MTTSWSRLRPWPWVPPFLKLRDMDREQVRHLSESARAKTRRGSCYQQIRAHLCQLVNDRHAHGTSSCWARGRVFLVALRPTGIPASGSHTPRLNYNRVVYTDLADPVGLSVCRWATVPAIAPPRVGGYAALQISSNALGQAHAPVPCTGDDARPRRRSHSGPSRRQPRARHHWTRLIVRPQRRRMHRTSQQSESLPASHLLRLLRSHRASPAMSNSAAIAAAESRARPGCENTREPNSPRSRSVAASGRGALNAPRVLVPLSQKDGVQRCGHPRAKPRNQDDGGGRGHSPNMRQNPAALISAEPCGSP